MFSMLKKISPSAFYIVAAILCEIAFSWTTSPLQSPDEFNHFFRAYQIAEGHFLPQQQNRRLGGEMPYAVNDFVGLFRMESVVPQFKPSRCGDEGAFPQAVSNETIFCDFPNTSYYSPVCYLPQALAIFVLKQFNEPVYILYYGGRLSAFLLSLFVMSYVIRIMPVFRWLFTLLALLPMQVFITNSFSADTVTDLLSFLFIALVFKAAFQQENITRKTILLLCLIAALLALAKTVYVALVLLVFCIPTKRFNSRKHRIAALSAVFLCALVFTSFWSYVLSQNFLSYQDYNPAYRDATTLTGLSNYAEQKKYILGHPLYFPTVIWKSIFNSDQVYVTSYIGHFGVYLDVPIPFWVVIISYLFILLVAVMERNDHTFSKRQTFVLILSAFACFVLLLLSQHLTWDPVAHGKVDLVQGRYLAPLLPLLFVSLGNAVPFPKMNMGLVVMPFILFLNFMAVRELYKRYIYESFTEVHQYTCGAEEIDQAGDFKTSDKELILDGCFSQSSKEKRNGNFSAFVSPTCAYSFAHTFKGFKKGDILDVSLWKKGQAALCMGGGKEGCGQFYNEFDDVHYVDRKGWKKIHGILILPSDCDSFDVVFYVRNKDDQGAYVDDLTITIKKNKRE